MASFVMAFVRAVSIHRKNNDLFFVLFCFFYPHDWLKAAFAASRHVSRRAIFVQPVFHGVK